MRAQHWILAAFLVSALHQHVQAAGEPSEIIVGKWKLRRPASAMPPKLTETFEFNADGSGKVSKASVGKIEEGATAWAITATYGNACIIKIDHVGAPKEVPPLILLLAFDGSDTALFQGRSDRITYMDREKAPDLKP